MWESKLQNTVREPHAPLVSVMPWPSAAGVALPRDPAEPVLPAARSPLATRFPAATGPEHPVTPLAGAAQRRTLNRTEQEDHVWLTTSSGRKAASDKKAELVKLKATFKGPTWQVTARIHMASEDASLPSINAQQQKVSTRTKKMIKSSASMHKMRPFNDAAGLCSAPSWDGKSIQQAPNTTSDKLGATCEFRNCPGPRTHASGMFISSVFLREAPPLLVCELVYLE